MVQYVGVGNMVRLIGSVGIEPYLVGLADYGRLPTLGLFREGAPRRQPFARRHVSAREPSHDRLPETGPAG